VGSGNMPVPVLAEEFGVIQRRMGADEPMADIKLKVNDPVKIKEGAFANFEGKISDINKAKGKVTVLVNVFDRDTKVELGFEQVIPKV
ncbi:MAG TPA: KOW motif-containing protein, partial [Candidatus Gracilibacteria bacterium]